MRNEAACNGSAAYLAAEGDRNVMGKKKNGKNIT
jgi:hypothetical protein